MQVIDRRLNPKSKSLGNRQHFIRRAKAEIREAVNEALKKRKVSEVEGSERISIRSKSLREPTFTPNRRTGTREFVLPGNKDFSVGDVIQKPPPGAGGSGSKGSPDGSGEDDFVFTLTKDEFLDLFFEDLRLPNLVKAKLKAQKSPKPSRAGLQSEGPPAKLNRIRTMRNSLARRIALSRPSMQMLERLERELAEAEGEEKPDQRRIEDLRRRLQRIQHLRRTIAYIDPLDLRYNRFERTPKPVTQAVMFCLMDVSASMTEELKDLAKRFFMLLHVFLTRHYNEVDVVFIRHTTEAQEVPEEEFFKSTVTGGTVISSALEEMLAVVADRYPVSDWNIYAAQASDGHNFSDDMSHCLDLLEQQIVPMCQYFAYIEVQPDGQQAIGDSIVWRGYEDLKGADRAFAMRRVSHPGEIYPVFRELFSSETATT
ncbi:MAG: YeaH/YhbH family protein [Hyphomicrobiaceae bacterium]